MISSFYENIVRNAKFRKSDYRNVRDNRRNDSFAHVMRLLCGRADEWKHHEEGKIDIEEG